MTNAQQAPHIFSHFKSIIAIAATTPRILKASVRIALVVGTVLNMINQGKVLFEGGPLSISQLLMNYLVPFCVSSYSAARNELALHKSELSRYEHN